ncbi:hypothetical protein [Marinobacterium marinum]|uniref:Transmembrane protein n=1 Tax=Marinobacterium marinum TaxID=2756129 RepID=A0A7W1WYR0_9GAMM|nr:hypothetical protein [Marinobacterium marinum]MBA4502666.1 hypothetical protein [Marinobacterium marinum]
MKQFISLQGCVILLALLSLLIVFLPAGLLWLWGLVEWLWSDPVSLDELAGMALPLVYWSSVYVTLSFASLLCRHLQGRPVMRLGYVPALLVGSGLSGWLCYGLLMGPPSEYRGVLLALLVWPLLCVAQIFAYARVSNPESSGG